MRSIFFHSILLVLFAISGTGTWAQKPTLVLPAGHEFPLTQACFSPDRKLAATCNEDEMNVKLWETNTGKLLRTINAHTDKITTVAFSPDGKYLLTTGHDQYAKLWDVQSGELYYSIYYYFSNWIQEGIFSRDGRRLLLFSADAMELHDVQAKKIIRPLADTIFVAIENGRKYRHKFIAYDMSGDGNSAITANSDSSITLWDLNTGKIKYRIKEGKLNYFNCLFSPSSNRFSTCSSDSSVKIWETSTGKILLSQKVKNKFIYAACFSPDEKQILTCLSDSTVKTWDIKTRQLIQSYSGNSSIILSGSFSNQGNLLLTKSMDGTICLWDAKTAKLVRVVATMPSKFRGQEELISEKYSRYTNGSFSKDDKKMITASFSNMAVVQETLTGKLSTELKGASTLIYYPTYSPDGNMLATAGLAAEGITNGIARIWDLKTGKILFTLFGHTGGINDLKFSPDNKWLVTVADDSTARIWDTRSGNIIRVLGHQEKNVYKCYITEDSKYIITQTFAGCGRIWEMSTGKMVSLIKHDSATADKYGIYTINVSENGKFIKAGFYDDDKIIVKEISSGKTLLSLNTKKDSTYFLQFDPSGNKLVYCKKNTIYINDIITGATVLNFQENKKINNINFSVSGNMLVASFADSTVKIWGVPSGKLLADFKPYRDNNAIIRFTSDDKYFVTYSFDSLIRVWSIPGMNLIRTIKLSQDDMFEFCITKADKHYVVTRNFDRTMKIWDLETGTMLSAVPDKFNSQLEYNINPVKSEFIIDNKFSCDIYQIGNSSPSLKIIPTGNSDYLLTDSAGRYDGTEASRKLLYFACGTEVIDLDQLKDKLWVPNLAERILKGDTINAATLSDLNICGLTPLVETIENTGDKYNYQITSRRGGLGETILYVNDIEVKRYAKKELLPKSNSIYELVIPKKDLATYFVPGQDNEVSVKSLTAANDISSRSTVIGSQGSQQASKKMPNLFAVVVGVSDYKGDELDLKYAAKDANDFAGALENSARKLLNTDSAEHVFVYRVHTADGHYKFPEKNSIKTLIQQIGTKAQANDILLIFFAGHGKWDKDKNQFFFLTADASNESAVTAIADVGISTQELTDWIKPSLLKAQKRILIFDACNSGQAIKDLVKIGNDDQKFIAARNDEKAEQIKAVEKLNNKSGLFILSASASNQYAYEMGRYAQGLLTYSLLKAIKEQPDILDDQKYLNLSRWFDAAEKTVSTIAAQNGNQQQPQIVSTTNFNIGIVDDEVRTKVILPNEKPLFAKSEFRNTDLRIDNLKLRNLVDNELNTISTRGTENSITYSPDYAGSDAYALTGDYKISGETIVVSVILTKAGTEIKNQFEIRGNINVLSQLAADISKKGTEWVAKNAVQK